MTPSLIRLFTAFKVLAARAPNWCVKGACRPSRRAESSISPLSVARQGALLRVGGWACRPSCRRPQFPPAGAGRVVAKCPALGHLAPSVGGFSPHALRPLVGQRGRLSGRLSGLACRSGRSTLGFSRVGAGLVARVRGWLFVGACAGLVARVCGWLCVWACAGRVASPWGELH